MSRTGPRRERPTSFRTPERDRPVALVVEDDPERRREIREVLRGAEWRVHEARSGEEALRILTDSSPDVVLLDLALPGISGLELLRELKSARWSHRPVPIVVVSSYARLAPLVDLHLADATVQKPFRPADLLAQIGAARSRRRRVPAA